MASHKSYVLPSFPGFPGFWEPSQAARLVYQVCTCTAPHKSCVLLGFPGFPDFFGASEARSRALMAARIFGKPGKPGLENQDHVLWRLRENLEKLENLIKYSFYEMLCEYIPGKPGSRALRAARKPGKPGKPFKHKYFNLKLAWRTGQPVSRALRAARKPGKPEKPNKTYVFQFTIRLRNRKTRITWSDSYPKGYPSVSDHHWISLHIQDILKDIFKYDWILLNISEYLRYHRKSLRISSNVVRSQRISSNIVEYCLLQEILEDIFKCLQILMICLRASWNILQYP